MKLLSIVALVAGCTSASSPDDVVGPFTGEVQRYVVDRFVLPANNTEARELGDDLDGDRTADNQAGMAIGALGGQGDTTSHGAEMIAAGAIASTFEIQAGDLQPDLAGVSYLGADDYPATAAGGRFVDGSFASNRTRTTRVPGRARVVLPVLTDADPLVLDIYGMEIDLTPDGAGGYDGLVRGVLRRQDALDVAIRGVLQMIEMRPRNHRFLFSSLDRNSDGQVTHDEAVLETSILAALLTADLDMFDGDEIDPKPHPRDTDHDAVSIGFGIHLAPCAAGRCAAARPPSCFDRVRNGTETDVDCGGSCEVCEGTQACAGPGDCQTGACDAGHCRAPTCSDGRQDGYESAVDCGGTCSAKCQLGQGCQLDTDCASHGCSPGNTCLP